MHMGKGYTIQKAAELTGLTPHVIRAWEKRYGVVEPVRTEGNQREYSDRDILRLKRLSEAVSAGIRIGSAAKLNNEELSAQLDSYSKAKTGHGVPEPNNSLSRIRIALNKLDYRSILAILDETTSGIGIIQCIDDVIVPLMTEIGSGWREGQWRIYHEHLASTAIRAFLNKNLSTIVYEEDDPVVVVATPEGQGHDLGSLTVAIISSMCGLQVRYTGSDLPREEIIGIVSDQNAHILLLSVVFPQSMTRMKREITALQRELPKSCRLILGGPSARFMELEGIDVAPGKMGDLRPWLGRIRDEIGERKKPRSS